MQCWRACVFYEENRTLPTALYFSVMMYKCYYHLEFLQIKQNEEGKYIHNKIFTNISHLNKNRLHVDCIPYKNKVIIQKRSFILPIPDSMITVDLFQKHLPIINFTTDDMTSKFEFFKEQKNALYLTESIRTDWLHMLDDYQ